MGSSYLSVALPPPLVSMVLAFASPHPGDAAIGDLGAFFASWYDDGRPEWYRISLDSLWPPKNCGLSGNNINMKPAVGGGIAAGRRTAQARRGRRRRAEASPDSPRTFDF